MINETINIEQIATAFESNKHRSGESVKFNPEIKVKREKDMLYISELRKTKVSMMAVVEVYNSNHTDKAPMPLNMLDNTSLKAIYIRLSA